MPHAAERQSPTAAEAATPPESPNPAPTGPDGVPAKRAKGALFRALVDAGADAKVAYTADDQIGSMISESVAVHTQPVVVEIRQLATDIHGLKAEVQGLKEAGAERDRKLDVLVAQMRILLGGLGLLVTVLIAVFGFLFAT